MSRPPQHKDYDEWSLAMNRLIAIRPRENPTLLDVARQMLNGWKRVSHNTAPIENGLAADNYLGGSTTTILAG